METEEPKSFLFSGAAEAHGWVLAPVRAQGYAQSKFAHRSISGTNKNKIMENSLKPENNAHKVASLEEYKLRQEKERGTVRDEKKLPEKKADVIGAEKFKMRREKKRDIELLRELGLEPNATEDEINRAITEEMGGFD